MAKQDDDNREEFDELLPADSAADDEFELAEQQHSDISDSHASQTSNILSGIQDSLSDENLASLTDILLTSSGDSPAPSGEAEDLTGFADAPAIAAGVPTEMGGESSSVVGMELDPDSIVGHSDSSELLADQLADELQDSADLADAIQAVQAEAPAAESPAAAQKGAAKSKKKKKTVAPEKLRAQQKYLEWAGLGVAVAALIACGALGLIYISTAVYALVLCVIGYTMYKGQKTNTVYTVILGCALAAVVTSLYCLWMELGQYQFTIRPSRAKGALSAAPVGHSDPANTTAAAWPNPVRLTTNADGAAADNAAPWMT